LDVNPVGSTFNIQNSIPHKSQKAKAVAEINRPKEFQRGTAEATESAKERAEGLAEGSDIGLGPGDRAFEPHYSDRNPSEIVDFRGICYKFDKNSKVQKLIEYIVSLFLQELVLFLK